MQKRHRIYPSILENARELHHAQTRAEGLLWGRLRNRAQTFKFRRQHPIDRFIVDFYCAEARLVIELDGDSHTELDQAEYNAARTDWLEACGYKIVRFSNEDVYKRLDDVTREIYLACTERSLPLHPVSPDI
jgi:very-short-patch-repair endonuclease